jgi:3-dehydroquinate synthase
LEKIVINTAGNRSEITVGVNWESVREMLPPGGVVIITDENVLKLYGNNFPDVPVISVPSGENSKSLTVVENLAEQLLSHGIDRSGFILAVGGGVVCDLAGFLSSVYMRGIGCGYVSTSLLSQVDASTGGKNGVNLAGIKNIIGVIRQPEFVLCDTGMLLTLPDEEFMSGMAELIKTAIIGDEQLFCMIEQNFDRIMKRDTELLTSLVARCVRFKAAVVTEDERETGLRKILNFGHTFGHAIEMYKSVKHGFAVASGMELATQWSLSRNLIDSSDANRIMSMIRRFGFRSEHDIPEEELKLLILHDKKKTGSGISFVFTTGIGKAETEKVSVEEIVDFYSRFRVN